MDSHGGSRRQSLNSRSFSVEDAEQELRNSSSVGRGRPSVSKRRSHRQRPSLAEVHFTDDPSVGATSTPIPESHLHVHHHPHDRSVSPQARELSRERGRSTSTGADEGAFPETLDSEVDDGDDSGSTLIHTTDNDDEFDDYSDTASIESFTLRERQDAINETHPFGIRIWKPALYKKSRSVQRIAEGDIHSAPGKEVTWTVWFGNYFYSFIFGIPLWLVTMLGSCICFGFFSWSRSARQYGRAFYDLANYLIFPFGKFVQLDQDGRYALEDEGEGRSLGEYEEWRTGNGRGRLFFGPSSRKDRRRTNSGLDPIRESDGLLGANGEPNDGASASNSAYASDEARSTDNASVNSMESGLLYTNKRRFFGRGDWNVGRVVFYIWFYLFVYPALVIVAGVCWFVVFAIPMARVNVHLCSHLRRHPLALSFHYDGPFSRNQESHSDSTILLCTYRAFGWNYYKYTVDGTNVFLMNLMFVVVFTIFDQYLISKILGPRTFFTTPGVIFVLALFSVIPLAYFIGMAVASISAQSSMGMGAAINAFFSTIVEVFLYCVALTEGKGRLVEGSIIGSILAGVLVMPGISMCAGALKRKTQRYNPKSAGVSSTMLLFAVIAVFAPTLFYQIYGSYQLYCMPCSSREQPALDGSVCRRCQFFLDPITNDHFYRSSVKPFSYICAVLLFVSYTIGLWFTLRTHAALIWQAPGGGPSATSAPVVPVVGVQADGTVASGNAQQANGGDAPSVLPVNDYFDDFGSTSDSSSYVTGNSNSKFKLPLLRTRPAEVQSMPLVDINTAADAPPSEVTTPKTPTAVVIPTLAEDAKKSGAAGTTTSSMSPSAASPNTTASRRATVRSLLRRSGSTKNAKTATIDSTTTAEEAAALQGEQGAGAEMHAGGGHDAPNWSKTKSSVVLLGATILYAVIAEILVDTVDVVLDSVAIDEKFLGITLFALVPNTTEFLNAISFAMNGNIALSMEIGSAYVLQVCLLQIPALILFSIWSSSVNDNLRDFSFTLVFPRWDLVVVVLCVFLLSYIYAEGRSNYFKGSILLLSYFVVMAGFWFSGQTGEAQLSSIGGADSGFGAGSPFIMPGGIGMFV
ncbi:Sodium/calcium exchanger protein-domain-containing protein [Myxozyma melibiosi]|uniref:Sodium/calcium exchanger protein-domain-containing protein n=1 Tax=Myxozyma melibiosi TaxID=54550 RepID=A0ABR1FAM4_9ASCO